MKIGFIGLGIMGIPMCTNIVKKHNDTVYAFDVHDADHKKRDHMAEVGAVPAVSMIDLARNSDIVITMVPKSEHSRAVYEAILSVLDHTKTCIDMSTIDPQVSIEIAGEVKKTGAKFVDAPVVKSKPAAIAGKLGVYVGGEESVYERIKPILLYMAENVIYMGENGKGLVMKICHNALVAEIQNGVNETAVLAAENGIDILTFAQAVSYGGAGNFYLDSKKQTLYEEDYTTAFSVENVNKDINICLNMAEQCGLSMPGAENARRVYLEAIEEGFEKDDFSITIKIVRGRKKEQ